MKPDLPGWRDVPIACVCGSYGPFFRAEGMVDAFRRPGKVKRIMVYPSAHLLNCQRCGRWVMPYGETMVERHADAFPKVMENRPVSVNRTDPPSADEPAIEQRMYPPRTPPPLPRKRPRV